MRKSSKKHTVTLSASSSIDKFPKPNSLLSEAIQDAKQVYNENKSISSIRTNVTSPEFNKLSTASQDNLIAKIGNPHVEMLSSIVKGATEKSNNHLLWNRQGNMISSDEHKKLLESTSEEPELNYTKLDDDFNKKLNRISSSCSAGEKAGLLSGVISGADVYKNFHNNMKTYPAYMSVEGATILNVAFATEQSVTLDKFPDNDIKIINQQLDKLENHRIDRSVFTVKLDDTKDFELYFNDVDFKLECGGVKIRLFNTVIHPEPINTIGVPVMIDGKLLVEASPLDVKVKDGTLELNGVAGRFKYLAGITNKEEFKSETPPAKKQVTLQENNEPVIIKNKNAYEIRNEVLTNTISWVKWHTDTTIALVGKDKTVLGEIDRSSERLLSLARKFYDFVENKK